MAILATQKVLTLDYWKPAHDLKVGDYLFDKDGKIVQITVIQQYRAENCYEVTFDDTLSICGDHNLRFWLENTRYRWHTKIYKNKRPFLRQLLNMSVKDLLQTDLRNKESKFEFSVPTTKPLQFPEQILPVPPFIFGFWYFNRRFNKRLAAPVGYSEEVYRQMQDHGYKVKEHRKVTTGGMEFSTTPKIESHLIPNIPIRIPNNYLLASADQRLELLRGILHAKSRTYNKNRDRFSFSSVHYTYVLQVQWLAESLGHKTSLSYDRKFKFYSVKFKSRLKLMEDQNSPPLKVHHARRYIRKIEQLPEQLCVHVQTNGKDNSFLVGEGLIACH